MISLTLAAAIAVAPISPPTGYTPDPRALLTYEDYPPGALARGEQGTVIVRLVINPTGRVETCTVVYSSHSSELDNATCGIIQTRARFMPAQNETVPIYSVMISPPISWSLDGPSSQRLIPKPDVELQIGQSLPGIALPLDLWIHYVVSAEGKIVSCNAASPGAPAAFVTAACDPSNLPPTQIFRNIAGRAVEVLYSAKVRFVLDKR